VSRATDPPRYDVFLAYARPDERVVDRIARRLQDAGIAPWLDRWCLTAGAHWQQELADGLRAARASAVFVGPGGLGAWEREEFALALDRAAREPDYRVIPVLLPGVPDPFDPSLLPTFLALRTWVDLRQGTESADALQRLVNAVKGVPSTPRPAPAPATPCPYLGLRPFDEEDAPVFFGREAEVQRLLEKLKGRGALAVIGASGTGKSSLVRAGLVPALRRGDLPGSEHWTVRVLTPGSRPLGELAAQLSAVIGDPEIAGLADRMATEARALDLALAAALPGRAKVVWVVDQLEELFTVADRAQARAFVANLVHAIEPADGRSVGVLTLRADFYPHCVAEPRLAAVIATNPFVVAPMTRSELRVAIEAPACEAGLELEQGLADTILDDVARRPGGLPLLSHALLELWAHRRGSMLTLEGYRETGGVGGAVAQRAEAVYAALPPQEQRVARRILLRLTEPGNGTEDTRRRAAMRELIDVPAERSAVERVTAALLNARLLTASGEASERWIEVSHEALIHGWPRLRRWLDEGRDGLVIHRRLTNGAEEWERLGHDKGLVQRGHLLEETLAWRRSTDIPLNDREQAFLDASVRIRRRARARRTALQVAAAAVVVVLALLAEPELERYIVRAQATDRSPQAAFTAGPAWLGGGTAGRPRQRVLVHAFSIDLHEVTNAQYRLCVRAQRCAEPNTPASESGYREAGDRLPVVYVTALAAAAFCRWLGRRLPSEAEWERAARGTGGRRWPWGDKPATRHDANVSFGKAPSRGLVPVDDPRFPTEGVVHLVGNAREWTATPEGCPPYACERLWDGTSRVAELVRRGGSWMEGPVPVTGADATAADPSVTGADLGFRCASSND
jgi:formylglycine-generating enzyme required for sulfatase activity